MTKHVDKGIKGDKLLINIFILCTEVVDHRQDNIDCILNMALYRIHILCIKVIHNYKMLSFSWAHLLFCSFSGQNKPQKVSANLMKI